MATRTFALRALTLSLLAGCAAGDLGSTSSPIINGAVDYGKDLAVNLVNLQNSRDQNLGSCSGTFITRRVVLTAAHCTGGFDGEDHYYVWMADTYNQATEAFTGLRDPMPYKSLKAAVDPAFDIHNLGQGHDVGLIYVDRPLPDNIQPMPLYPQRLTRGDVGETVRFIGFGIRQEGSTSPLLEKLQASAALGFVNEQTLGWTDSTHHTCQGDSGGPNLLTIGNTEYIAGVTSFGVSCNTDSNQQRVDTELAFIRKFIADNDPQAAPPCSADGKCDLGCSSPDPDCPCGADSVCNASCSDPDKDPDCPMGCGQNGACVRSGCPTPDPDCGNKQTGDTCSTNNECVSGLCAAGGSSKVCVPACDASGGCPSGYSCTKPANVCLQGDSGGGCSVAPGAGPGGWLALVAAALLAARRRRSAPR